MFGSAPCCNNSFTMDSFLLGKTQLLCRGVSPKAFILFTRAPSFFQLSGCSTKTNLAWAFLEWATPVVHPHRTDILPDNEELYYRRYFVHSRQCLQCRVEASDSRGSLPLKANAMDTAVPKACHLNWHYNGAASIHSCLAHWYHRYQLQLAAWLSPYYLAKQPNQSQWSIGASVWPQQIIVLTLWSSGRCTLVAAERA